MDAFVQLAKQSLESYIKTGQYISPPSPLPDAMDRRAAVFVSLKKRGELRGCIGSMEPALRNIAEEIIRYGVLAGTQDPRFPPVREEEMRELVYSVDVLGDAEPVESADDLDAMEYGVTVSCGMRRGVLLPNLEGVDTPAMQISIALSKAGIGPGEPYMIERFRVERHK